ncbi:MAG: hypothetical protein ACI3XG_10070, partial [Faecousia sp.]
SLAFLGSSPRGGAKGALNNNLLGSSGRGAQELWVDCPAFVARDEMPLRHADVAAAAQRCAVNVIKFLLKLKQ